MASLKPVTPGELLLGEFLIPMGITQYRVAKAAYDTEVAAKELATALRKIRPWVVTAPDG